jgi:hypothetical protein
MTKPSREKIMTPTNYDDPKTITERVKKLRTLDQTEKVKNEIASLIKEYKKRFLKFSKPKNYEQ